MLRLIRNQRAKEQGNKGTPKKLGNKGGLLQYMYNAVDI